jgi:hypothetical protein
MSDFAETASDFAETTDDFAGITDNFVGIADNFVGITSSTEDSIDQAKAVIDWTVDSDVFEGSKKRPNRY